MPLVESHTAARSRVAIIRCSSYERRLVEQAMKQGIDLLGGCGAFARSGERILFKPNVLWGSAPSRCIVTHPEVLRAAVAVFTATSSVLQYGDSSAGVPGTTRAMDKCGYRKALDCLPAEAVSFNRGREADHPAGIAGKRLRIAGAALDADGIINLPKLKTHGLVRMTGAVKNLFGCVPGMTKGHYHARFPDPYDFAVLLVDIVTLLRPRLHIMDAIEAMEGNGPQSGRPKKMGVLLMSTDPVALDVAACRLIDLDPAYVPTIAAGFRAGLGNADIEKIDFVGDDLTQLINHSFDAVRKPPVRMPASGILGEIKRFFLPRPVIRRKKCTKCGCCVAACPIEPPALKQCGRNSSPEYNYRRCIRCYCCQEVCPCGAIVIRQTAAGVLLPFAPYISLLISTMKRPRSGGKQQ